MNAAGLQSPRLQRVLAVLTGGRRMSTRAIMRRACVCAVSACVAELRQHGAEIICTQEVVGGKRRFFYTMTKGPAP
jgi:hypothetical protein